MDLMRRNPKLNNWNPLSVIRTITEAFAVQFYHLDQNIATTSDNLFVNTATGSALDRLVLDRLPLEDDKAIELWGRFGLAVIIQLPRLSQYQRALWSR